MNSMIQSSNEFLYVANIYSMYLLLLVKKNTRIYKNYIVKVSVCHSKDISF
jgi:hypothetical protein